jgi:hypothetical protein
MPRRASHPALFDAVDDPAEAARSDGSTDAAE